MILDFSRDIRRMIGKGRQNAILRVINHTSKLLPDFPQEEKREQLLSLLKEAQSIIESNSNISAYHDVIQKLNEYVKVIDTLPLMIKVSVEGKENLGLKYYSNIIYSQLLLQDIGIFFYNKKELVVSLFLLYFCLCDVDYIFDGRGWYKSANYVYRTRLKMLNVIMVIFLPDILTNRKYF